MSDILNISDLIPDERNHNKGKKKGQKVLKSSFDRFGAGRSILLDKNLNIIAGNKATEQAKASGIQDVIIVQTTGNQLVAVQRMDVDLDSKEGRELAIADNAAALASIEFDNDMIFELHQDYDLDLADFDIEIKESQAAYEFNNTDHITKEVKRDTRGVTMSDEPKEKEETLFPVSVLLSKQDLIKWKKYKDSIGIKADSQAFNQLLSTI